MLQAKKSVSFQLPEEALASKDYMTVGLMNQPAIPDDYDMFMDPEVVDALEALEDEDFVVDELEQDFFAQMDADGVSSEEEDEELDEFAGWEDHYRQYKKNRAKDASDDGSEGDDRFGNIGRRTTASRYSMTSSAMFRNEGQSLHDEKMDRMLEQYDETDDEDDCPQLELREDFHAIADDFLENFEVVGRRMVPRMEGETSMDKFDRLRESLIATAETKQNIQSLIVDEEPLPEVEAVQEEEREARWDCESILSTYSNIYNRPALITESSTKIRINSRGFPRLETIPQEDEESESESDDEKGNPAPVQPSPLSSPGQLACQGRDQRREEGSQAAGQGPQEGAPRAEEGQQGPAPAAGSPAPKHSQAICCHPPKGHSP